MRSALLVCLSLSLVAASASAGPFVLVDSSRKSFGVEGGATFGSGSVQPGFSIGGFHSYNLNVIRPDVEAYAVLSWQANPDWLVLGMAGGGYTVNAPGPNTWSARTFFVVTQTKPIAFRTSNFFEWIPETRSVYIQQRLGPSVALGESGLRIFPWLAPTLSAPGTGRKVDVSVDTGVTLYMFF